MEGSGGGIEENMYLITKSGSGGGVIYVESLELVELVNSSILADGEGYEDKDGSNNYGGGSGGSILI